MSGAAVVALGREAEADKVIRLAGLGHLPRLNRLGDTPLHIPAWDHFRAGYTLARDTLDECADALAPVLDLTLGGAEFRRALLVRLAYGAMSAEAPLLAAAVRSGAEEITLVNGAVGEGAATRLAGRSARALAAPPAWRPALAALDRLTHPWWRRPRRAPFSEGLLAIVGGASEWPTVEAAIAALPPEMGVTVLLKTGHPVPSSVLDQLATRPHVVGPLAQAADGLVDRRLVRLAQRALAHQFLASPRPEVGVLEGMPAVLAGIGTHALGTARWALALNGLVEHYRPRLVLGALEKTIHGPVLTDLRRERDLRVVNLQHGVIARSGILAHMSFDAFLTWGAGFNRACLDDGYGPANSLVAVGNPLWLDLATGAAGEAPDARATIGVLPQPSNKGYISPAILQRLYAALAAYADSRPHVRLLIKQHPADSADPFDLCPELDALRAAGRLEVLSSGEAARQLRGRVALTVTVYSTAALDCLAAGIPGISFDPACALDHMEAQVEHVLPRATSEAALHALLDRMLTEPTLPTLPADLFPAFAEAYADRIGAVIRGLLQR